MKYTKTNIHIVHSETNIRGRNTVSHILHTIPTRLSKLMLTGIAVFIALSVAVVPYSSTPVSAACSSACVAALSVGPASGSYNPDNTFVVSVYVNSGGQTVNAVQADFTYTSSLLQFQSINTSGSAFDTNAPSSGGGGSVSIVRGNIGAISGSSLLVAQVNFKVIGSAGTAGISFNSSSSAVASSTTNQDILGSVSGATYTVTTPPPPVTPPPASGGNTPTPPSSGGTAPKPSTGAPSTTTPTPTTPGAEATPEPTTTTTDTSKSDEPATVSEQLVAKKNNTLLITLVSAGIAVVAAGTGASWWFLRRRHHLSGPDLPPLAGFVGSTSPSVTPPVSPGMDNSPSFGQPTPQPPAPTSPIGTIPSVHHSDTKGPFNWGS